MFLRGLVEQVGGKHIHLCFSEEERKNKYDHRYPPLGNLGGVYRMNSCTCTKAGWSFVLTQCNRCKVYHVYNWIELARTWWKNRKK